MVRISSNMSMMLLDAGLSVPRPTRTPSCSRSASGAMPQPSLALLLGQCATATSLACRMRMSSRVTLTQCTARKSRSKHVPLLEVLDGRDAVGLHEHALPAHLLAVVVGELARAGADVGELFLALRDVAQHLEAALAGEVGHGLVQAAGHGVGRVRREPDVEARRARRPGLGEPPLHVRHGLVEARVVHAEDLEVEAAAEAGGSAAASSVAAP